MLVEIEAFLPWTIEEWRTPRSSQLAVERLWILAGNLAEAHRVDEDSQGPSCKELTHPENLPSLQQDSCEPRLGVRPPKPCSR